MMEVASMDRGVLLAVRILVRTSCRTRDPHHRHLHPAMAAKYKKAAPTIVVGVERVASVTLPRHPHLRLPLGPGGR